jgi:hypothetical protein
VWEVLGTDLTQNWLQVTVEDTTLGEHQRPHQDASATVTPPCVTCVFWLRCRLESMTVESRCNVSPPAARSR